MGYPPWLWKAPNFSLPFHCRHMPPVGADGVEEWVQQQWDLRLPEKLPASWARWFLRDWCIHIYMYIYNVQYCGKLKIKGNPFALCLKVYWSKKILNVVWLFVGFAGLMCFFCSFLKSPQIVSQSWNQRNQQWCQCNVPRVETSCWVDFLRTCQLFYELYYVIPIRSIATDLYLEHQFFFQNFETSS